MKTVSIDFTGYRYILQLHEEMKNKLDFPDFYGENLSALWDCLTGFIEVPVFIEFHGINTLKPDLRQVAIKMIGIFERAKSMYNELDYVVVD